MSERQNNTDLSQLIAENFGANATYVESLFNRFRSDPSLVDESWRAYFAELLGTDATVEESKRAPQTSPNVSATRTTTANGGDGAAGAAAAAVTSDVPASKSNTVATPPPTQKQTASQ
nr:hypothetical protein [Acidobacteriota bacterium]